MSICRAPSYEGDRRPTRHTVEPILKSDGYPGMNSSIACARMEDPNPFNQPSPVDDPMPDDDPARQAPVEEPPKKQPQ